MAYLTKHASARMSQRCGIQKKSQAKVLRRVIRHGVTHSEASAKANLCRWIDGLYLSHRNPTKILLYGNGAYLFKNDTLLTVIKNPDELQNAVNALRVIKGSKLNGKEY